MRDIDIKTRLSAHSFVKWHSGNTSVEVGKIYDGWTDQEKGRCSSVYLHNNFIYEKRELYDGTGRDELFTMSGWNTATTRARLNALLDGVSVVSRNYELHLIVNGVAHKIDAFKYYQRDAFGWSVSDTLSGDYKRLEW